MNKSKNLVMRLTLALVMMLALGLTLSTTASAHAHLASSTPGDGQVLTAEPTGVSGTYTEEVDTAQSYMKVYYTGTNGSNIEVDNGDGKVDANNRKLMNVTLKSGMGDGSYLVKWHTVTDDDGGIVDGSFTFTVKSSATASGPTSSVGTQVESGGDAGTSSSTTSSSTTRASSGTLPTTGNSLDGLVFLAAGLGALVLGAGLTMRRTASRR